MTCDAEALGELAALITADIIYVQALDAVSDLTYLESDEIVSGVLLRMCDWLMNREKIIDEEIKRLHTNLVGGQE